MLTRKRRRNMRKEIFLYADRMLTVTAADGRLEMEIPT